MFDPRIALIIAKRPIFEYWMNQSVAERNAPSPIPHSRRASNLLQITISFPRLQLCATWTPIMM